MIFRSTLVVQAGLFLVLLPSVSLAAIFTNFGPGQTYNQAVGNIAGNDFVGDNLAEGDTFTPTASAQFGSIGIALSCEIASCPDLFTVDLTSDSGSDSPGMVLESFTSSGLTLGPLGGMNTPIQFIASGTPVVLTAGKQYWITLSTDLNNSIAWNLNSTGDVSDQAISGDGGATYFSPSGLTPGAYQINAATAAVPEPNMSVLLAMGYRRTWGGGFPPPQPSHRLRLEFVSSLALTLATWPPGRRLPISNSAVSVIARGTLSTRQA